VAGDAMASPVSNVGTGKLPIGEVAISVFTAVQAGENSGAGGMIVPTSGLRVDKRAGESQAFTFATIFLIM
jgi:hypothetical protein